MGQTFLEQRKVYRDNPGHWGCYHMYW